MDPQAPVARKSFSRHEHSAVIFRFLAVVVVGLEEGKADERSIEEQVSLTEGVESVADGCDRIQRGVIEMGQDLGLDLVWQCGERHNA
jgi:hypothetical protein